MVTTIESKGDNKRYEVLCGNSKLMNHFKVLKDYSELEKNVTYLEEEGKTVVILAIDGVP